MIWQEFKDWLTKHEFTNAGFCQEVGIANSQVSKWRTDRRTPGWTQYFTELYDEVIELRERLEPTPEPAPPDVPLFIGGACLNEAEAEKPETEITGLPDLKGMPASVAEARPIRQKIITEQTSAGWWVKVLKDWAK